jgi:phospholipid transport system substrate-binding protein
MIKKLLAIVLLFLVPLMADELQSLQNDLRKRIDTITMYLTDKTLSKADKNQNILSTVDSVLDFTLMSQLSLDKTVRAKLTPEELKEFNTLFEKEIKDSFLTKLENYSNEKIELKNSVKTQPNRISVFSVIKGKKEDMEVVFKYYLVSEGLWKIYDLEIAGVSLIQSYRTQFSEIVTKDGVTKLLEKLRQKQ